MALREELKNTGNWMFRWRSYLPLILILLFILAMPYFEYPRHSHKLDQIWEIFCLSVSVIGLGIRIFTIAYTPEGTSGTNTKRQIANKLNTTGIYSLVRHPLYLGNFIMWFGISMFLRLWWFSLIVILIFWLYYERIMFSEEEFLREKFGDLFLEWADKTPAFIPNLKNWRRSDRTFSFRKALKNEYKSLFAMISAFTVIEIIGDIFSEHTLKIDKMWSVIFTAGLVFYIVIIILKKKTTILRTDGK